MSGSLIGAANYSSSLTSPGIPYSQRAYLLIMARIPGEDSGSPELQGGSRGVPTLLPQADSDLIRGHVAEPRVPWPPGAPVCPRTGKGMGASLIRMSSL